jgi:hypothetical protein
VILLLNLCISNNIYLNTKREYKVGVANGTTKEHYKGESSPPTEEGWFRTTDIPLKKYPS